MEALLRLRQPASLREVVPLLADKAPFIVVPRSYVLGRPGNAGLLLPYVGEADARLRLGVLVALRRTGDGEGRTRRSNSSRVPTQKSGVRRSNGSAKSD